MWSGYRLSHTILMPSLKLGLLLALSSLQVQSCRLREISPVGGLSEDISRECQRCGVERVSPQDYIVGEKSVEAQSRTIF